MKLYYYPLSTYSQKVLIALYEKQLEFESELVFLFDPEAATSYKEIYPLGKIPLLVNEEDMVPESSIIVEYLDRIGGACTAARKRRVVDRERIAAGVVTIVCGVDGGGVGPGLEGSGGAGI